MATLKISSHFVLESQTDYANQIPLPSTDSDKDGELLLQNISTNLTNLLLEGLVKAP